MFRFGMLHFDLTLIKIGLMIKETLFSKPLPEPMNELLPELTHMRSFHSVCKINKSEDIWKEFLNYMNTSSEITRLGCEGRKEGVHLI